MKKIARNILQFLAERAARNYVVGAGLSDAVVAARFLEGQNMASTICFWDGETDKPRQITDRYLSVIETIGVERLDCYASIKPWPLHFSHALLSEVFECARQHNVALHFDSFLPATSEQTFALIKNPIAKGVRIGCTIPGAWQRSLDDARVAIELDLSVRVVKGQWADQKSESVDPKLGFLKVVDGLSGRCRHVSVATHDPALAREALTRLRAAGTPSELELLFGLPIRPCQTIAETLGVPIRVYLPFGHAWLPYVLSQARRNPVIAWWILRDLCTAIWLSAARLQPLHLRLPR
jgi:proline dehydrogenase